MIKNKGVLLFSLGFLSVFLGTYVYFYIDRNRTAEFTDEKAEVEELLRQFLVMKGLQDNATNRIKYSQMTKEDLEKALGY
jgi:hypothetical protein